MERAARHLIRYMLLHGRRTISGAALAAVGAAALIGAFSLVLEGCGSVAQLRREHYEESILENVKERVRTLEKMDGRGTLVLEYGDQTLRVPFGMKATGSGLVEVEADVSSGFWPGLSRVQIVSDPNGTNVYAGGVPVDSSVYLRLGPMIRPMLLSIFGGGDMIVHWLVSSGCPVGAKTACSGLEIGLGVDSDHRSVDRWTLKDRDRKTSFNGYVLEWDTEGRFPRIVTGMFHPQEISVTVEFDQVHVALGPGNFIRAPGLE